jgi:hypothetical protein
METEELRDAIWDYLYEAKASKTLVELATYAGRDPLAVTAAVNHEWFDIAHDRVSIAYVSGSRRSE